ncbi:MAG: multiheme c-type cytochrome, partial [Flavobacteriales bacterium]|nr:multiheme c-type cytochrome [Flavobacteriales bacterium]
MRNATYIVALIVIAVIGYWTCKQPVSKNIQPLSNPWEFAAPHQEIPEGLTSLSSATCGACHQEHYKEWQLSTHAHAWTDLQYQAELKKESSPFMCINCHIPLQNQQEFIIKGLVDGDIYQPVKEKNPNFDKALQQEGINCASCHVRNGAVLGPTGTDKAPHTTVKDTTHLSEQLCISCHNANAVVTPTLACTFETGDEWKAGPFYGQKNCISCHMEETH